MSGCRWPEKRAYPTKADARAAITSIYRAGKGNPDLEPYACDQHWHVGHGRKHFHDRIRNALRGTPRRKNR